MATFLAQAALLYVGYWSLVQRYLTVTVLAWEASGWNGEGGVLAKCAEEYGDDRDFGCDRRTGYSGYAG
tara:strand:- start:348 stop:554 length:207 start_codon:yes stop_codon:yes gene_type:complete